MKEYGNRFGFRHKIVIVALFIMLFTMTKNVFKPVRVSATAFASVVYNGTESEIAGLCFDYVYYADNNEDLKKAYGYDAAKLKYHWLTWGIKEGRSASPILDLNYYIEHNEDLKKAYGYDYTKAYNHFCQWGYAEYRPSSQYYNGDYYRKNNEDLSGYDSRFLLVHYITYGIYENRYANIIKYINPLKSIYNGTESEIADLCFNYVYYADNNKDLKEAYGYNEEKLRYHWLTWGIKEGRSASPILDLNYYVEHNDDLKKAFGNDYIKAYNHFCQWGYAEYRPSSKYYNGYYYHMKNYDLVNYDSKFLLRHYLGYGVFENRDANTIRFYGALTIKEDNTMASPVNKNYTEKKIKITSNGQVVDTFNGVPAQYIKGVGNSNTGKYCCARYVSNYYSNVYGVSVANMFKGKTPSASSGYFYVTSTPEAGDIGYQLSGGGGHWFIIKSVNDDGTYSIIEQNWKWKSGNATYCYQNRKVSYSKTKGFKVFRWSNK